MMSWRRANEIVKQGMEENPRVDKKDANLLATSAARLERLLLFPQIRTILPTFPFAFNLRKNKTYQENPLLSSDPIT